MITEETVRRWKNNEEVDFDDAMILLHAEEEQLKDNYEKVANEMLHEKFPDLPEFNFVLEKKR
jgi:hypothetical protein